MSEVGIVRFSVLFLLAALAPGAAGAEEPAIRCEQLVHWQVPGGTIHLPTRGAASRQLRRPLLETRTEATAGSTVSFNPSMPKRNRSIFGSTCRRAGTRRPSTWEVVATTECWLMDCASVFPVGRSQHPIATGYVTFGSDSGQSSMGFMDPAPGAFALNEEELESFGGAQLKKTHDVALELIRHYYGSAPKRIYFYGNSQGGHEGLVVAQRWPNDYDGIVEIHPAYDFTALQLSGLHLGQVLPNRPQTWLSPPKVQLIATAVLRACDGLDGLGDDVVGNVAVAGGGLSSISCAAKAARTPATGVCPMSRSKRRERSISPPCSASSCGQRCLPFHVGRY